MLLKRFLALRRSDSSHDGDTYSELRIQYVLNGIDDVPDHWQWDADAVSPVPWVMLGDHQVVTLPVFTFVEVNTEFLARGVDPHLFLDF